MRFLLDYIRYPFEIPFRIPAEIMFGIFIGFLQRALAEFFLDSSKSFSWESFRRFSGNSSGVLSEDSPNGSS